MYVSAIDDLKAKGVKDVYIVSVNDMFVMKAWGETFDNGGKVRYGEFGRVSRAAASASCPPTRSRPTSACHLLHDATIVTPVNSRSRTTLLTRLAGDDAGALSASLGLVLDAQPVFGGPRLKRAALVIEDGKVLSVVVEPNPGEGEWLLTFESDSFLFAALDGGMD